MNRRPLFGMLLAGPLAVLCGRSGTEPKIIMGLVYYLVITPFALVLKVTGKDAMRRKFAEQETYRVTRKKIREDSLEHPY